MKTLITTLGAAALLALFSLSANAAMDDAAATGVLKAGGCASCHALDKKKMGPAVTDIAAKRKGQPDAVAALEKSVRDGSKGVYGAMAMPAIAAAKISDADLKALSEWMLTK